MANEVALVKTFLRVITFSLVSILLPLLRILLDLKIQNHILQKLERTQPANFAKNK